MPGVVYIAGYGHGANRRRAMQLQFVMCGEANAAFFSQAAMFRLLLDYHGGWHAAALLTLCLGTQQQETLPPRWRKPLERVELRYLTQPRGQREDDLAQSMLAYESVDPAVDVTIICDADTVLLRPLPQAFLEEMVQSPALAGCIAHFAPPLKDVRAPPPPPIGSADELWSRLSQRLLGYSIDMPYRFTLRRDGDGMPGPCPFYINLGFLAGTPRLLASFHQEHARTIPHIREVLDNRFYEQLSVPFAIERAGLASRALPFRYNFPNDPLAEQTYPEEADNVIVLHYMRTAAFHRHRVFSEAAAFEAFMQMPLGGSNAQFQRTVRDVTSGIYPF